MTALATSLSVARRFGLPATLTAEAWAETADHFSFLCAYCEIASHTIIEHFIPLRHGGGTTPWNCLPSCESCNLTKKSKLPEDFARDFGADRVAHLGAYLARRSIGIDVGTPPLLPSPRPRPATSPRQIAHIVRVDKTENAALYDLRVFLGTPEHPATAGEAFRWLLNGYRAGRLVDHGAVRVLATGGRKRPLASIKESGR